MELIFNNQKYQALRHDQIDQELYDISQDGNYLFTMGLNEHAEWEPAADVDMDFVKGLGALIENEGL